MEFLDSKEIVERGMIVKHIGGSRAYGTHTDKSDTDLRGVFVAPAYCIRTPFFKIEQYIPEKDIALYELCNYMKLAVECNPNIIETLWVDESDILFSTEAYEYLRANRDKLLSSKVAFTTSGYALAQLKRIKGQNKWINNPQPEEPPRQADFVQMVHNFTPDKLYKVNLREYTDGFRLAPFGNDIHGLYRMPGYSTLNPDLSLNVSYEGDTHILGTPMFLLKFNRQPYDDAKTTHGQYWEWKKNRNHDRSQLEHDFGYDTKHAMHLVRLLRMGYEALTEGVIKVKRPDAKELLEIRDGKLTYEELVRYAEDMDAEIRGKLYQETKLRKKPDIKFAAELTIKIQDVCYENRNHHV